MKKTGILILLGLFLVQCQKKQDYKLDRQSLEINDFVWKAMNAMYLWKDKMPDLADEKFNNQDELNTYLQDFNRPDDLFEHLIYQRQTVDHWSWIVDDYEALLQLFQGIRKTTGMHIGLVYEPGSNSRIFAYVKYVVPHSDAAQKAIKRGDLFRKINGQELTVNNYRDLLQSDAMTIELATWTGQNLEDTGNLVTLQKSTVSENPIFINRTFTVGQHKVGYLMYNGFMSNYDEDLNRVFAGFKAQQIDKLIIDLRYNPGGSVQTLDYLAGMITGQFTGQTLLKYHWHHRLNDWMIQNYPENLTKPFLSKMTNGTQLNHLKLNDVIFIATKSSASASESLINSLRPYIHVTQIGTPTHGKYTASITMFDSPDFSASHINPNHKWALQPIVLKVSNVDNVTDFTQGLTPDIYQPEDYFNLGILGDTQEPLLKTALEYIDNQPIAIYSRTSTLNEIYYKDAALSDAMYLNSEILKYLK